MTPLAWAIVLSVVPTLCALCVVVGVRIAPRTRGGSADWHAGYDVGRDEGFGDGWRGGYAAGIRAARLARTPGKARQDRKG